MSDRENLPRTNRPQGTNRPLSEISHLFLSSLREQAGGEHRARPVRLPPGQRPSVARDAADAFSFDESFGTRGEPDVVAGEEPEASEPRRRVTAIVGAHLSGQLNDAVLAYAASLAAGGSRVGVMSLDDAEFRLQLVECDADVPASEPEVSDLFDVRQMHDVMLELNHEVDRWLLVAGDHRRPEARSLLARADDWTMLSTCDHDGVVSGYRTLKGLAEGGKAPLAIALVDAPDDEQAQKAFTKLSSVCGQFLDWDVRHEALAGDVEHAQAHTLLWCHSGRDEAHVASGPQWRVANDLLAMRPDEDADRAHFGDAEGANAAPAVANQPLSVAPPARPVQHAQTPDAPVPAETAAMTMPTTVPFPTTSAADHSIGGYSTDGHSTGPLKRPCQTTQTMDAGPSIEPMLAGHIDGLGEVIDLPDGVSVLSAILRGGTQLLATPIAPPMCPGATVAVGRDRALVLVAQTGAGLAGMESIAAAVRWLDDSKQLIAMAMPQLAIDAAAPTQVQLLIDHNDRTADGLRPLLGNSRITIRSYRRLRWAGRNGLLLDAA